MFRFRQIFKPAVSCAIFVQQDCVLDNGIVEHRLVDASTIVLPPVENFDLGVLLKAGVPLKQVNCKLIQGSSVSVALPEESSETSTTKTDKEN